MFLHQGSSTGLLMLARKKVAKTNALAYFVSPSVAFYFPGQWRADRRQRIGLKRQILSDLCYKTFYDRNL